MTKMFGGSSGSSLRAVVRVGSRTTARVKSSQPAASRCAWAMPGVGRAKPAFETLRERRNCRRGYRERPDRGNHHRGQGGFVGRSRKWAGRRAGRRSGGGLAAGRRLGGVGDRLQEDVGDRQVGNFLVDWLPGLAAEILSLAEC